MLASSPAKRQLIAAVGEEMVDGQTFCQKDEGSIDLVQIEHWEDLRLVNLPFLLDPWSTIWVVSNVCVGYVLVVAMNWPWKDILQQLVTPSDGHATGQAMALCSH